ncbi:hypothetical protein C8A05DRAFT_15134 [Staphylotrichum tortipilum]|uniref:BTB domain-containing protein n=1 Tax=Staphylotrichum tortipilum TaxID=2831512 RepID=A0AAN6MM81_9PEZI|nr:hypothetical protein C8A05DRAFT_15134 [Staphylotrichum longicolle]
MVVAAAAPPTLPPTIQLDPDGDLLLRVGTKLLYPKPRVFKVCSAALRRASPVWKAMLFGPFTEAKPAHGDWIVELPEDDPDTLMVLLGLLHGVFEVVPPTVSLTVLYGVLIVADKYAMVHLLRPVVNAWAGVVKIPTLPPIDPVDAGASSVPCHITPFYRIHAAWQLGCDTLVAQDMASFIFNFSRQGQSFTLQDWPILPSSHHGPPDLIEVVTKLRRSLLQSLLDFYQAEVACRMPPKTACIHTVYGSTPQGALCDSLALGAMWRRLESSGGSRLPKTATQYDGSPNELMKALRGMFSQLPAYSTSHEKCLPGKKFEHFEKQTRLDERWRNPLQPHHKEQMQKHRERCGLSPTWNAA